MNRLIWVSLLVVLWSVPASAYWELDNDRSTLNFTSTKANTAAEVSAFRKLEGTVDQKGNAKLTIDLGSVDTTNELRDQRMRDMLFETAEYPKATITLSVDPEQLDSLQVGEQMLLETDAELSIHGTTSKVPVAMTIARLQMNRLLAISAKPIVINAGQVGLEAGLEKLREVAGLPSISTAVPVTFILSFNKK